MKTIETEKKSAKITWDNICSYFTGHFRYKLYYSRLRFLLPLHIREQYERRLKVMNKKCFNSGSCVACGCEVPMLQFANKSCERNCYSIMMSAKDWIMFKRKKNGVYSSKRN